MCLCVFGALCVHLGVVVGPVRLGHPLCDRPTSPFFFCRLCVCGAKQEMAAALAVMALASAGVGALGAPAGAPIWPMLSFDVQHSGHSTFQGPGSANVAVNWSYSSACPGHGVLVVTGCS